MRGVRKAFRTRIKRYRTPYPLLIETKITQTHAQYYRNTIGPSVTFEEKTSSNIKNTPIEPKKNEYFRGGSKALQNNSQRSHVNHFENQSSNNSIHRDKMGGTNCLFG